MNPYAVLGVSSTDTDNHIRRQYLRLVKQYHPDLHPDSEKAIANKKMQIINQAYEEIQNLRKSETQHSESTFSRNTFDDFVAAAQAYWSAWSAWSKAYEENEKKTSKRTSTTKNTNRYAFFRRAHDGAGSYKTVGSDTIWSRVLFNEQRERFSALVREMYSDVAPLVFQNCNSYSHFFYKAILDRLLYYAAVEYIDPFASLKRILKVSSLDGKTIEITVTIDYIDTIANLGENTEVILKVDSSKNINPYVLHAFLTDGTYIGNGDSDTAILLSLIYLSGRATFSATVLSQPIKNVRTYNRRPIETYTLPLLVRISSPDEPRDRYLPDNKETIENILITCSDYSLHLKRYFSNHNLSTGEALAYFETLNGSLFSPDYERCYKFTFSVVPVTFKSNWEKVVNGICAIKVSLSNPIYAKYFDRVNRETLFAIYNACTNYEAVSTLFSIGRRGMQVETRDYYFRITINQGNQPSRYAIGVYIYSKRSLRSLLNEDFSD